MGRGETSRYEEILLHAMEIESAHYLACERALASAKGGAEDAESASRLWRDGQAASAAAAALGAAQRFVRDHGSLADAEIRRLARHGQDLGEGLPEELQLLFRLHHVDGYPLSVYSTATGMTQAEAAEDYRDLILALSRVVPDWPAILQAFGAQRPARSVCDSIDR
jgi:hypothetical protein